MSDQQTEGQVNPTDFEDAPQEEHDMDALFNVHVSTEAQKKIDSDILQPAGNYITVPEKFGSKLFTDDNGRIKASFFGEAVFTDKDGKEHVDRVRYTISPVAVYKKNKDGEDKPDFASKLWSQAVKAYTIAYGGEAPTEVTEKGDTVISPIKVKSYLEDYAHIVRSVHTQDGDSMVVSIRAIAPEA